MPDCGREARRSQESGRPLPVVSHCPQHQRIYHIIREVGRFGGIRSDLTDIGYIDDDGRARATIPDDGDADSTGGVVPDSAGAERGKPDSMPLSETGNGASGGAVDDENHGRGGGWTKAMGGDKVGD